MTSPALFSTTLIAHRGASAYAPENTLEAFELARQMGANWAETDVVLTKDGVAVLFHDDTLERMTGEPAHIANLDYANLENKDVGSWFDAQFSAARIPTLKNSLERFKQINLALNLELKPAVGQEIPTVREAIRILRETEFPKDKLIISSFSLTSLEEAYRIAPEYHYGWLADDLHALEVGLDTPIPWYSIHLKETLLSRELITRLKNKQAQVLAYTVNDPARAQILFTQGVDAIFTDKPDLI